MRVPIPQQLSSVPEIDNGAMGWAANLVDGLGQLRVSQLIYGNAVVTWPGGQAFSTALQVTHNLPRQGKFFLVQYSGTGAGVTAFPAFAASVGASNQQMQVQAWTIDGQLPANGSTAGFYWLVGY